MKLGFEEPNSVYSSNSQKARVWTERWIKDWIFCPNCGDKNIDQYTNNKPVADFFCKTCNEDYELKSQKSKFGNKVVDGAFRTMCERLESLNNPNLVLLNYDIKALSVTNLLVVPKHFFVRKIIEERPPLPLTAKRAGWIGCNILLNKIPEAGKIFVVQNGQIKSKKLILKQWQKTLFLRNEVEASRGWLIDVMKCIEKIGKNEFQLQDIYAYENQLKRLYPNNRHVKQKIRQQLQFLRDEQYLTFEARGNYRLK